MHLWQFRLEISALQGYTSNLSRKTRQDKLCSHCHKWQVAKTMKEKNWHKSKWSPDESFLAVWPAYRKLLSAACSWARFYCLAKNPNPNGSGSVPGLDSTPAETTETFKSAAGSSECCDHWYQYNINTKKKQTKNSNTVGVLFYFSTEGKKELDRTYTHKHNDTHKLKHTVAYTHKPPLWTAGPLECEHNLKPLKHPLHL